MNGQLSPTFARILGVILAIVLVIICWFALKTNPNSLENIIQSIDSTPINIVEKNLKNFDKSTVLKKMLDELAKPLPKNAKSPNLTEEPFAKDPVSDYYYKNFQIITVLRRMGFEKEIPTDVKIKTYLYAYSKSPDENLKLQITVAALVDIEGALRFLNDQSPINRSIMVTALLPIGPRVSWPLYRRYLVEKDEATKLSILDAMIKMRSPLLFEFEEKVPQLLTEPNFQHTAFIIAKTLNINSTEFIESYFSNEPGSIVFQKDDKDFFLSQIKNLPDENIIRLIKQLPAKKLPELIAFLSTGPKNDRLRKIVSELNEDELKKIVDSAFLTDFAWHMFKESVPMPNKREEYLRELVNGICEPTNRVQAFMKFMEVFPDLEFKAQVYSFGFSEPNTKRIPYLIKLLDHPETNIRAKAYNILHAWTLKSFGYTPDMDATSRFKSIQEWQAWWVSAEKNLDLESLHIANLQKKNNDNIIESLNILMQIASNRSAPLVEDILFNRNDSLPPGLLMKMVSYLSKNPSEQTITNISKHFDSFPSEVQAQVVRSFGQRHFESVKELIMNTLESDKELLIINAMKVISENNSNDALDILRKLIRHPSYEISLSACELLYRQYEELPPLKDLASGLGTPNNNQYVRYSQLLTDILSTHLYENIEKIKLTPEEEANLAKFYLFNDQPRTGNLWNYLRNSTRVETKFIVYYLYYHMGEMTSSRLEEAKKNTDPILKQFVQLFLSQKS